MKTLLAFSLITLLISSFPGGSLAAENSPDKSPAAGQEKETEGSKKAARHKPFRGKLDSLDTTASTIRVGERTFAVTSATRVMKGGRHATLADARPGEEVAGAYREGEGGRLELLSLRIGPKPAGEKEPEKPE